MLNELENYLESLIGKTLLKEDQQELINKVRAKDSRGRILKSHTQINKYLQENNISFQIHAKRTSKERYWEVVYLISFEDYLKKFSTYHEVKYLLHKMSS